MKKLILLISTLAIIVSTVAFSPANIDRQDTAHEIAELARSLGLPESDPIIVRAKEIWHDAEAEYTDEELQIVANVIYYEAPYCTDRHQQLVAAVLLNRVQDPRFPNTIEEVVRQPKAYLASYVTARPEIPERIYDNAKIALSGRVECPKNVIYQSQLPELGSGHYEVIKVDTGYFRSTTYFSFG